MFVAPSDNFVHIGAIFFIFVKKCKNENLDFVHRPLPTEILETIIKAIWTEQCLNVRFSKN